MPDKTPEKIEDRVFSSHDYGTDNAFEISFFVALFIILLMGCVIFENIVSHKYHIHFLPGAGAIMLLGMVTSLICLVRSDSITESLMGFDSTIFFVALLPPIIFNSGYSMKRRFFFENFFSILAFAILGTSISIGIVGVSLYYVGKAGLSMNLSFAECLTFGALISSTDPVSTLGIFQQLKVDPLLFYLVFGESLLNDAVAIVSFRTFSKFVGYTHTVASISVALMDFLLIIIGSTALGISLGCLSALLFKHINLKHSIITELAVYFSFAYLPFLIAETVEMSGIVAILFTGITMKHYTHNNLSEPAREGAIRVFDLLSNLCETSIFLNLGLSVFALRIGYDIKFISWALAICLVARALHVYPLSFLLNFRRETRIEMNQQHMLCFSGLRGAMAYALCLSFPGNHRKEIIATTMSIVIITVFIMGGFTVSMLNWLRIRRLTPQQEREFDQQTRPDKRLALLRFDSQYLMPFFTISRTVVPVNRSTSTVGGGGATTSTTSTTAAASDAAPRDLTSAQLIIASAAKRMQGTATTIPESSSHS